MSASDRPAERIRKLVALATGDPSPETIAATIAAQRAIAGLDTELLDTLAGQREHLREDIGEEQQRLYKRNARPGARTRELMDRSRLLLGHYEKIDALIAIALLHRVLLDRRELTDIEKQQLDGPVETFLDRFMRGR